MRQDNQAALDAAFRLTLDLADVNEHRGWRSARDEVLAALTAGPRLVALLGPPGTGKTLLLCELARAFCAAGRNVALVPRGDLQLNASTGEVVLVDEAARMEDEALDALALPGVAAVVADLPSFEARLDGLGVGMTVVRLAPLRLGEVGVFVADRLARAGLPDDLLTADAVEALAVHSDGVPRVLNLLARAALFMAGTESAVRVEERHVTMAVALREGGVPDIDGLSGPPETHVPSSPVPASAALDAACCAPDHSAQLSTETETEGPEGEAPPRAAPNDPAAPATAEAAEPEPPALPESRAPMPAPSRPRSGAVLHGSVLLIAIILLFASAIAGLSNRPYLAEKVRAVLTLATASAPELRVAGPASTDAGGEASR